MKKYVILLISILLCCAMLVGCKTTKDEKVDYSEYAFADAWWTREGAHDTETIHFGADGAFSYSCACGNAVEDYDLCDGYKYDDETKTITLECVEEVDDLITVIKVIKCEGDELHLDFDGETRIFTKKAN